MDLEQRLRDPVANRPATPAGRSTSFVLVVDDNPVVREVLTVQLNSAGYAVQVAEDAIVAGRLVLERTPALIILDVQMPFMNGYELANRSIALSPLAC